MADVPFSSCTYWLHDPRCFVLVSVDRSDLVGTLAVPAGVEPAGLAHLPVVNFRSLGLHQLLRTNCKQT